MTAPFAILDGVSMYSGGDIADSLHPNDAGYQLMADVFNDTLLEAMASGWIHDPVVITSPVCNDTPGRWFDEGVVASGVGVPGSQVQFADLNGDGRADYLTVDSNGAVSAWINGGPISGGGWNWYPQGEIASGVGAPGTSITFADLNGDHRADYLVLDPSSGAVTAWLNGGPIPGGGWNWYPQGEIASGVGAVGVITTVQFANVNCDPRDDYLSINLNTGAISAWISGGGQPSNWTWIQRGQIAGGVGVSFNGGDSWTCSVFGGGSNREVEPVEIHQKR